MRRVTRAVNPIGKAMAGHRWFKLYGLLVHTGRKSGQEYRIAIVVRPFEDGFVIPMPFGPATQWAKNVIAAGGATVIWNGRTYRVTDPRLDRFVEAAGPDACRAGSGPPAVASGIDTYMQVRIADDA